jgi:hypothetical protein
MFFRSAKLDEVNAAQDPKLLISLSRFGGKA